MATTRVCKTALLAAVGFFLLLVVFNNLTDYGSNFAFVQHVLAMDTTFPGNNGMWRSIQAPWVYHGFYATIILWEAVSFVLIGRGALELWRRRHASAREFNLGKSSAVAGLTLSLLQWFVAFISVGGEWFLMWQSRTWNGQDAAFRMFACLGLVLVLLLLEDGELDARTARRGAP